MSSLELNGIAGNPECVEQKGIVVRQDGDFVEVMIVANSACVHCAAKGSCQTLDSKEKLLRLRSELQFKAGDSVLIRMESRAGLRAVLLGFVLPLIALVAGIIITFSLTGKQGLSALAGLSAAAVYYLALTRFSKRLERSLAMKLLPFHDDETSEGRQQELKEI